MFGYYLSKLRLKIYLYKSNFAVLYDTFNLSYLKDPGIYMTCEMNYFIGNYLFFIHLDIYNFTYFYQNFVAVDIKSRKC